MKRTKCLITALLIAALLLGLLSACAANSASGNSEVDLSTVLDFSIGPDNALVIENPPAVGCYEILVDGVLIGVPSAADVNGWVLPDGAEVQIRYVNDLGEALTDWSEPRYTVSLAVSGSEEAPTEVDLSTVLDFSISPENILVIENPPAAGCYEILVDGVLIGVPSAADANGWVLPDDAEVQIRYVSDSGEALTDWSEPRYTVSLAVSGGEEVPVTEAPVMEYPVEDDLFTPPEDAEYITFSATENTIDNLVRENNGSYILTAYSNLGNPYRFRLEGKITPVDGAWGCLSDTSVFYSLDATPGIVGRLFTSRDPITDFPIAYGYELDGNDTVQKKEDVDVWQVLFANAVGEYNPEDYYANYIMIGNTNGVGTDHVIDEITIYFDGIETVYDYCTPNEYFYRALYLPGSLFLEDPQDLMLEMHFLHDGKQTAGVDYFENIQIGALRDADGNEITQSPYYLGADDTLDLTLACGFQTRMKLAKPAMSGKQNMNEARGFSFSDTVGTMNVLVVPMYWSDQADRASDHSLDLIYRALGNVMDVNGNVTVYAPLDPTEPSLSEFYYTSSYGQLTVNTFVTDWYERSESFDDARELSMTSDYQQIYQWLLQQYPDLDLTRFDNDKDGILDEIIFINTGDMAGYNSYSRESYAGAYRYTVAYGRTESACQMASVEQPAIHHYINLPLGFLFEGNIIGETKDMETSTLIHEFGHSLGLWDYYDTGDQGVSFLGGFDLMDSGEGDMNVYSKYAIGWITPTVVDESSFATTDTVTVTLRSSTLTGDALLIPAAGYDYNGTPFDEYLMVDLFTPEGLNEKGSATYGLEDTPGVRIYHISNLMEEWIQQEGPFYVDSGRETHINSSSEYWYNKYGMCEIELVCASGKPFGAGNGVMSLDNLFLEGSSFRAEDYVNFFYEGRMDRCAAFGYVIEVVSISQVDGEYAATVQVTRTEE